MSEITFIIIEDEVSGGYVASAIGHSIHTQADTLDGLREMMRDVVEGYLAKEPNNE